MVLVVVHGFVCKFRGLGMREVGATPCPDSKGPYHAIGIHEGGHREVLGVDLAPRESQSSWKDFLVRLKDRGLRGVEFVVSDDHAGLKKALTEVLTDAAWQRCYVHFLRNALDYLPRKADDDCLQELRWLYDRRDLAEAQRDLARRGRRKTPSSRTGSRILSVRR